MRAGQPPEPLPQSGRAVLGGRLVTGLHLYLQHQAQVGDEVGVVGVGGAARLVGVIALQGPFLMAVKRLDRYVGIENPRLPQ